MRDRRPVDELTIEELEEVLRVRKRQARLERLRRLGKHAEGRVPFDPLAPPTPEPYVPPLPTDYRRFENVGATASYRPRAVAETTEEEKAPRVRRPVRWGWVLNKSLLVIELGLVIALALVLLSAMEALQEINRASTHVYQTQLPPLPTPTPTPVIRVALLPGGHTPPDSPGGPAPQEIPAHLRHLVEEVTPLPVPTPGPEHAVRIVIPSISVDAPVVEGDDWESLKRGAGHHIGSANPGESGNCIISAHNDIFGEIFRYLSDVELGSEVFVYTTGKVYRYVVTQKRIIDPTDVSVMYPTSSPVLTLISCYPYGIDTHRIVVIGELRP
jgi:sortase A